MPAPAALPATPTVVVATLPAIFTGVVTRAQDETEQASAPIDRMRKLRFIFFCISYSLMALIMPDLIFLHVLV